MASSVGRDYTERLYCKIALLVFSKCSVRAAINERQLFLFSMHNKTGLKRHYWGNSDREKTLLEGTVTGKTLLGGTMTGKRHYGGTVTGKTLLEGILTGKRHYWGNSDREDTTGRNNDREKTLLGEY